MSSDYWESHTPWTEGDYEELRKKRYELQDYMQEIIGFDKYKGKKVLELGCGSGIDAAEFSRNGAEVIAVDNSVNNFALTLKALKPYHTNSLVMKLDLEEEGGLLSRFNAGSFDLIYSFGVLHHLTRENSSRILKECYKLLKDNGELLIMVYNINSLLYKYSIAPYIRTLSMYFGDIGGIIGNYIGQYSERESGAFTLPYSKDEIIDQLNSAGFMVTNLQIKYSVIDLPGKRKVKFTLEDGTENELGWHIIVRAKKVK